MLSRKCENCGYIFRPEDGSICPECLTSREDINHPVENEDAVTLSYSSPKSKSSNLGTPHINVVERDYTPKYQNQNNSGKKPSVKPAKWIVVLFILMFFGPFIVAILSAIVDVIQEAVSEVAIAPSPETIISAEEEEYQEIPAATSTIVTGEPPKEQSYPQYNGDCEYSDIQAGLGAHYNEAGIDISLDSYAFMDSYNDIFPYDGYIFLVLTYTLTNTNDYDTYFTNDFEIYDNLNYGSFVIEYNGRMEMQMPAYVVVLRGDTIQYNVYAQVPQTAEYCWVVDNVYDFSNGSTYLYRYLTRVEP